MKISEVPDSILLVGSQAANEKDRSLGRPLIKSVQVLHQGENFSLDFFSKFGVNGVSSIAMEYLSGALWFTTGGDLFRLNVNTSSLEELKVPGLKDVHEICIHDNALWMANTGHDEFVRLCLFNMKSIRRFSLRAAATGSDKQVDVGDSFHCNQVFFDLNGNANVLVHHVRGKQTLQRIAEKILKRQGDGGIICSLTGALKELHLTAPHSVRKIGDHYYVFDSGQCTLKAFDHDWRLVREVVTTGWGRGADVSSCGQFLYCGLSEIRRRYRGNFSKDFRSINGLEVFRIQDLQATLLVEVEGVEQINNVYTIPHAWAETLLASCV